MHYDIFPVGGILGGLSLLTYDGGKQQMIVIYLISGLFDRLFIDWYWVGKTKAWIIPGTEDMMPYIYGKTLIGKWVSTVIGFPILAILIAWVVSKL